MSELAYCEFAAATGTCIGIGMIDGRQLEPKEVVAMLPHGHTRGRRDLNRVLPASRTVMPHNMTIEANTTAVVVGGHNITTNATLIRVKREGNEPCIESDDCKFSGPLAGRVILDIFTLGLSEAPVAICEAECRRAARERDFNLNEYGVRDATHRSYTGNAVAITGYTHADAGGVIQGSASLHPVYQVTIPHKTREMDLIERTLSQHHHLNCHISAQYAKTVGEKFKVLASATARIMFAETIHHVDGTLWYSGYKARLTGMDSGHYAFTCSGKTDSDEIRGLYWLEHRGEMTGYINGWYQVYEMTMHSTHMVKLSDRVKSSAACASLVAREGYKVAVYNRRSMQCHYSTAVDYSGNTYDGTNTLIAHFTMPDYISDNDVNSCSARHKRGDGPYKCLTFPRDADSVVLLKRK